MNNLENRNMQQINNISEEFISSLQKFKQKNIYASIVNNNLDGNISLIEIDFDNLSDENKELIISFNNEFIVKYLNAKGHTIYAIKDAKVLSFLADKFQMQDVPHLDAYLTFEEFLIKCGASKEVDNPNYYKMMSPSLVSSAVRELTNYTYLYENWLKSDCSKKTLTVFDETKVNKSFDEYLKENGAIYEDNRVYLNEYHYQNHLKYLKFLNDKSLSRKLS